MTSLVSKSNLKFLTNTPKALANFSPGLERSDNPGETQIKWRETLKGFIARGTLSGFTSSFFYQYPGFSLGSNPGLELANAFGVFVVLTWLKLANAFGVTVLEIRRDWVFLSSDDPHQ